jgi:hypothetical protein
MPFGPGGTYTPPIGAENAFAGKIIASATWNSIFIDMALALSQLGYGSGVHTAAAGSFSVLTTDRLVLVTASAPTITLPAASAMTYPVMIVGAAAGVFSSTSSLVIPAGSDKINNLTTNPTLFQDYQAIELTPVSGGWVISSSSPGNNLSQYTPRVGYQPAVGVGGTVVQASTKSTAVSLNVATGQITMNNATLAAATVVSFTMTNADIGAADVLVLNHISGGTPGSYGLNAQCIAGAATINVRNNTAGGLGEAIVLQFALLKGSNN